MEVGQRGGDCDIPAANAGRVDDGRGEGSQAQLSQKRKADTIADPVPETKLTVCDRGGASEGYGIARDVPKTPGATPLQPSHGSGAVGALRGLNMCDRRASLELRCLGIPVRRPGTGMPSGLVISKINSSGPSRQEIPIKGISHIGADVFRHTVEEIAGGCDAEVISRAGPQPPTRGVEMPGKSTAASRTMAYHNGEAAMHHGGTRLPPMVHAAAHGDVGSAMASRDGRSVVGALPNQPGRASLRDGSKVGIPSAVAESGGVTSSTGGHRTLLASRGNGDPTEERQRREGSKVTDCRDILPLQRTDSRHSKESGILSHMLGHGILGNGEITLTPRAPPCKEDGAQRVQGVKRPLEGVQREREPSEKRAMLEAVNLMERGRIPERAVNLTSDFRSSKVMEAGHPNLTSHNSNGLVGKGIRPEKDEITIEPIMDMNRSSLGMRREHYAAQVRTPESFANRYPLLREGLSKPCLRRRGRPPKAPLQAVGRSRRYVGMRPTEYATYHAAQPLVSSGLNLPEGTVVNPLVSPPYRKTMSVDEVLSYYGSMQERKASTGEREGQRSLNRGEISMAANSETSMPAMQNSSLAQIESLVQSQVPSSTGFFPASPTSVPRNPYMPNSPPGVPIVPGYTPQGGLYAGQPMLVPDSGYYGARHRGRGRSRGRARARGRPRGNSGIYYHGTEREILPKPDYMPRHVEDVEEIVVEVDFKPEWDDEQELEAAKDDSLSEAQKLVPNWISVVPAKMSQGSRPTVQNEQVRDPVRMVSSVPAATEVAKQSSRGPASVPSRPQSLVPEKSEVRPSAEAVMRQPKENALVQMSSTEPKPGDTATITQKKTTGSSQRVAEKRAADPNLEVQIKTETVSDGDDEASGVGAGEVSASDGNETVEVCSVGDVATVENARLGKDASESAASGGIAVKAGELKTKTVEKWDRGEKPKETPVVAGKGRTRQENRSRFNQLASSLASIKSLPKDVTVVRSRGQSSPFDSYGRRQPAFPQAVAARLGPSIEIRRIGGLRTAAAPEESTKTNAGSMSMSKGDEGRKEGGGSKEAELSPGLSNILSDKSPKCAVRERTKRPERESGVDGLDGGEKVEMEGDDMSEEASEEEEEPEEDDPEEEDETYRPAGYRGMGRRRHGRGRRGLTPRKEAQKPRRKRASRPRSKPLVKVKVEEEERPGDWDVFVCDLCGRSFSKRFRLAHHIRAYHPSEGMVKGEDGRRVFPCQQCTKSFTRKANLKKHLRIHTGEKPFVCEECGRAFTFSKNLAQHRRVHGVERPFVCEVCGHAFRFSKNLSQHRGVHAHLKPHVCNVCGRGFTRSTHLSQHKRLHSGEKPFRCSVCGKRFAQRGHAALHTRIHTGERPYACPMCGRAFSLRAHLVRHVALHQRDGEMGPGRPPPLPRRDRRGRDGVELVGAEDGHVAAEGGDHNMMDADHEAADAEHVPTDSVDMDEMDEEEAAYLEEESSYLEEEEFEGGIVDLGGDEVPIELVDENTTEGLNNPEALMT